MATLIIACEKKDIKNICPVVSEKALPVSVSSAFQQKYPNVVVEKWFNKDNNGYCAIFKSNGKDTKVLFDNVGNFQKEEVDDNGNSNHHDDNDNGCECEIED